MYSENFYLGAVLCVRLQFFIFLQTFKVLKDLDLQTHYEISIVTDCE